MKGRLNIFWVGAVVVALGAVACDGSSDGGSVGILDWWKQGGEAEAIGKLLGVYKQRNPDVKIVDSSVDGSALARAAIRSRITDGNPPDTFQANGGWDLMAWVLVNGHDEGQSSMQELDPAMLDWIDKVPESVLTSVSYKDKVYGVPLNIHRLNTFFYNKEVFTNVGVNVGDLTTLDKLFEAAEKSQGVQRATAAGHSGRAAITPIAMGFKQPRATWRPTTPGRWRCCSSGTFPWPPVSAVRSTVKLFTDPRASSDPEMEMVIAQALDDFRRLVSY